ncbi:MAG: glycoside hydrolase family 3 C-terminal domain-containing protein [Deltaproteobacteria bacterium]|nr:glycoside hydrolase family 3 C-terminal domain-containing protein [Deltaproteobacteria bacterium]
MKHRLLSALGIPEYNWWNECLHGVARAGIATVFPQAIGMSAMWDDSMMYRIAHAVSDEARAKHHAFAAQGKRGYYQGLTFWTPNINIFRDPRWGRGMETYGEDPYLAGELAVDYIKGLQGDDPRYLKLVATAKHFVVHSGPEPDRHRFNATPADRDFVETYIPHFKKTVQEAGVYSVMCAYNRLYDKPCCGSSFLEGLLRDEWGFKGYIVSDCWAVKDFYKEGHHEVVETVEEASAKAVKAGTDLNCGDSYPSLVEAVKMGLVSEAEIDTCVTRLMVARMKLGMFDPQEMVPFASIPYSVVDSKPHQELALEAARKSMVLLKNDRGTLPFNKSVKQVAVIGPNADRLESLLANYNGFPSNPVTPYQGIKAKLPQAKVTFAPGSRLAEEYPYMEVMDPACLFTNAELSENGLQAEYFNNDKMEGEPLVKRVDPTIDFTWWTSAPAEGLVYDRFSVRWSGYLVPPVSGEYAIGGEGYREFKVTLDDQLMGKWDAVHHPHLEYEKVVLEAGKPYKLEVEYRQWETEYPTMKLFWDVPNRNLKQEALDLARASDVVVLCMGLSPYLEGEEMKVKVAGFAGGDRVKIGLPQAQTDLIKAVMQLNKPTVLVLLNGSALAINWEAEHVPAIFEAWYPGQAGGAAIADILFGDYNPSGRLPVTFYKSEEQLPPFDSYDMEGRTYKYFRGEPLYEFGYGLSYTNYQYRDLSVPNEICAGDTASISVEVTNTGTYDGEEVVQVYVSHPEITDGPIRTLQGFKRIFLKPGETRTVRFELQPIQIAVYHPQSSMYVSEGVVSFAVGGMQPGGKALREGHVTVAKSFVKGECHQVW